MASLHCVSNLVAVIYRKSKSNDLESTIKNSEQKIDVSDEEHELSCGKPVNFTFYDTLVGVMNRYDKW